jgi:hypothetical protein
MRVPHGPYNRLGRIGSIRPLDWSQIPALTTQSNEPYMLAQPTDADGNQSTLPPTSAAWMAAIIQRQSSTRESTPGTLTYTPTSPPQPNTVARWNSWAGPCAPLPSAPNGASGDASSSNAAAAPPTSAPGFSLPTLGYVALALAAAASAAYLLNSWDPRK